MARRGPLPPGRRGRGLAVGHRAPAGGAAAAPPRAGRGRAARRGHGRGAGGGRPGGGGAGAGRPGGRGRRARAARRPGSRGLAAAVRGGPPRGGGGGAAGGPAGHGEKPRPPGPAAAAGGAARRRGRGGRVAMSDMNAGLPPGASAPWATAPPDVDLGRVWTGVAAQVWRRDPGRVERLAGRLLRSPGLARALVATPSLLLAWIIATVVVLFAGAGATLATGTPYVALLAPAVAAAGIAYAYGPGIDPAWELSRSMAVSDRMVLLVRALAVFGLNAALGLAASALSGAAAALTIGWLVPMTAVSALALAAATVARSAIVGVAAGVAGWAVIVLSEQAASGRFTAAVSDSALRLPYLAVAVVCVAVALYA